MAVKSYVLVQYISDAPHYVSYGHPPRFTPDLKDARRYVHLHHAKIALRKLALAKENLHVEAIDE